MSREYVCLKDSEIYWGRVCVCVWAVSGVTEFRSSIIPD